MKVRELERLSFYGYKNILGFFASVLSLILVTAITVQFFAPSVSVDAEEQTASQTVGPNTISMSNNGMVSMSISPAPYQSIHTTTDTFTVTNSCPKGGTVTVNTNSDSDTEIANNLYRNSNDEFTKIIQPTTGDELIDTSWGYSTDDGATFHAVPAKDQTPAAIYKSLSGTVGPVNIAIKYGIKTDNNMPPGNYGNDIVYSVAVDSTCLSYSATWDYNEGTKKADVTYPTTINYGQKIDLTELTPTRKGYRFTGWTVSHDGSSHDFTGEETDADLNEDFATDVTITANWEIINYTLTYDLAGGVEGDPNPTTYNVNTGFFMLNNPTREGYAFTGWTGTDVVNPPNKYVYIQQGYIGDRSYTANWVDVSIRSISNMQDMTSTLCNNTPVGTVVTLKDTRDNNTYTVKKLKDGRCWMTDSLRIENKTVTSADSNIPNNESFTIMPHNQESVSAYTHDNEHRYYESIVYIDSTYGGYYDYVTATAGWYNRDTTTAASVATKDICPKGWSLPTNGNSETDFGKLYAKYNSAELLMGEPNFQLSGYYGWGQIISEGVEANYNTRNIHNEYNSIMYAMFINSSGTVELTHAARIGNGMQIRCIAKK